ncbi:TniQ family protein [Streptomyces sp. NPDC056690]|uniref:TniQ family protein n=1 Tax=unclassified Streptomyces TaxID=2593676 RepID=UPI00363EE7AD
MPAPVPDSPRLRPRAPRRLPAVPVPGTRESLSSWINRLCLAYEVRGSDIIAALGLNAHREVRPSTTGLALSPPSVEALGAPTGLSQQAIGGMLLSRFTATALANLPRPPYTQRVLPTWSTGAWVLRHHANFCPLCLGRNGRWRLEWKLPWSFARLDHMVYLRNLCPRCGRVQSGLSWGWDSRVCRLMKPPLNTLAEIRAGGPLRKGGRNSVFGGRLDEATTVPVTDTAAVGGQKRLIRWLYGTSDEAAQEREFASLVALAARQTHRGDAGGSSARNQLCIRTHPIPVVPETYRASRTVGQLTVDSRHRPRGPAALGQRKRSRAGGAVAEAQAEQGFQEAQTAAVRNLPGVRPVSSRHRAHE